MIDIAECKELELQNDFKGPSLTFHKKWYPQKCTAIEYSNGHYTWLIGWLAGGTTCTRLS